MPVERLITFKDVTFSYGTNPVVERVSFSIERGDYVGIIGPNGGGKSTTIKLILGLIAPSSGTVISSVPKHKIGYVSQQQTTNAYSFPATVSEIVASGRAAATGALKRLSDADRAIAFRSMKRVGIAHLKDRLISQLSGGERQRVFIARALAAEPELLVLDEPSVGVDAAAQKQFYELLDDLNSHDGITIVFVTHDIDVIAHEAGRVIGINHCVICSGAGTTCITKDSIEKLYGEKMNYIGHAH